jgi:hypothetical protein
MQNCIDNLTFTSSATTSVAHHQKSWPTLTNLGKSQPNPSCRSPDLPITEHGAMMAKIPHVLTTFLGLQAHNDVASIISPQE